tara:strand:+ start:733 stop:990 length:258 start_codon:yes stop_codon:yes gene_type:complete
MGIPYRKPPTFVVGDLVFFLGYEYYNDDLDYGVVLEVVKDDIGRHEVLYRVQWLNKKFAGVYSAGQLLLVYEIDPVTKNITFNKW